MRLMRRFLTSLLALTLSGCILTPSGTRFPSRLDRWDQSCWLDGHYVDRSQNRVSPGPATRSTMYLSTRWSQSLIRSEHATASLVLVFESPPELGAAVEINATHGHYSEGGMSANCYWPLSGTARVLEMDERSVTVELDLHVAEATEPNCGQRPQMRSMVATPFLPERGFAETTTLTRRSALTECF